MPDNLFLKVEKYTIIKLTTEASTLAKPFFEYFGFNVIM